MRAKLWASVLAGLIAMSPSLALAGADPMPSGVAAKPTEAGLALTAADGKPLYRLDLDRIAKRRGGAGGLLEQRCADICDRLWRPVLAPKDFKASGDWSVTARKTGGQLTYKGDPLYSFAGESLAEAAEIQVVPPYFSSYSAKPTKLVDGVPTATLYYHPALYEPPAPKVVVPTGVGAKWLKASYVFAAGNLPLYAPASGKACKSDCADVRPLTAPLAALPIGEWRPVDAESGVRQWAYRGRLVYQPTDSDAELAAQNWRPIEAR